MSFPYRDPAQAKQFVLEYAGRLRDHPEVGPGWLALKMIVGIHLEQPQIDFWVDARGTELLISEIKPGDEDASLTFTCDLFHRLFTGQEDPVRAFVRRKIKARRRFAGIIELKRMLPQSIEVYQQFLTEKALTA